MLDPEGQGHGADPVALAAKISDDPAVFAHLNVLDCERGQFPSPQRAADEKTQDAGVPFALEGRAIGNGEKIAGLLPGEPVSQASSLLADVRDVVECLSVVGCE